MNDTTIKQFLDEYEEYLPKLIRDNIPELIIKNEGSPARDIRNIENKDELLRYSLKKVLEEAGEMYYSKTTEELISGMGDLYELLDFIKDTYGIEEKAIKKYRDQKNIYAGSFKKKLVLFKK